MKTIPHPTEPIEILYEDEDILVLNKPSGLVVNDAESVAGSTIQTAVREYLLAQFGVEDETAELGWQELLPADYSQEYGTPTEIFVQREGMVHRLDRETSGVLIWAKNPGALLSLLSQFKNRKTTKKYLALCHGKFASMQGEITLPLGRGTFDRKKMAVDPLGRPAETLFKILQSYSFLDQQSYSLVECEPKTGRTHQIRVHMAQLQHPIVSDSIYGGKRRVSQDKSWCKRLFLHAFELTIQHPRTKKSLTIQAPLSDELQSVLDELQNK
ncbi:MAG: RluA family pseudouridine synthase [Microgenomates group bacterium]